MCIGIGDTVIASFDWTVPHDKKPPTNGHYHGPARIVAVDEWPLTEDAIYQVHPTGLEWVRRGDVFVTSEEVEQ